jgi:hypothetical protein
MKSFPFCKAMLVHDSFISQHVPAFDHDLRGAVLSPTLLGKVMSDRGGPGSWMWKSLPKTPVQGLPRPPGGAAALLGEAATVAKKRRLAAEAQEEARKKAAKKQKMLDLRNEFLSESRGEVRDSSASQVRGMQSKEYVMKQVKPGPHVSKHVPVSNVSGMVSAREEALQAYRLLKARQQLKQNPTSRFFNLTL